MSDMYEALESLGGSHPIRVDLTVAQAEDRERRGIPLPISGDAEDNHTRELLSIVRARRKTRATGCTYHDTGGLDEDGDLYPAAFHCRDCDLYYSWPVTPGLAANEDPLQTQMLALVAKHTPAACRAIQARDAVEREKELAAKRGAQYDRYQDNVTPGNDIRLTVGEAIDNERDGYPTPVGGDPVVTLQDAIDRGAVTVTKGLPISVLWRRSNPGIAGTSVPYEWLSSKLNPTGMMVALWPTPSHEALTDSITALADVQQRLMIGGVLQCRGDNTDARSAS